MGIKGFGKWLRTKYPSSFSVLRPANKFYDCVYVDVNSMLHCVARTAKTKENVFSKTRKYLKGILRMYKPREKLFLAMDGPASLLKLDKQRKRRIDAGVNAERKGLFDSQQFTPGCIFMTQYESFLIEEGITLMGRQTKKLEYGVSGAATVGEGETKIFHEILQSKSGLSHAIVTTDSDAMLQAVGHAVPRTFIVPPPWESTPNDIMNNDQLLRLLQDDSKREIKQMIDDFCFLVSLSGGDYLPGLQFGNFASLWPYYCSLPAIRLINTTSGDIRLADLKNLLSTFMQSEQFAVHQGFQRAVMIKSQLSPTDAQSKIVSFLRGVQAIANQFTGRSHETTISLDYSFPSAPSVGELVGMNIDDASYLLAPPTNPGSVSALPITAAIMMLDLNEKSFSYLPKSPRSIAREYMRKINSTQELLNDKDAVTWLNQAIEGLPRDLLSQEEYATMFPRPKALSILYPKAIN